MSRAFQLSHIVIDKAYAETLQPEPESDFGNADVLEQLLPELCAQTAKNRRRLHKVDHYMLLETEELYSRLKRFCDFLNINRSDEFKVVFDGLGLSVEGKGQKLERLKELLNQDLWFVDSFSWLQPNYALLAYSFEMLEFSEYYERAPLAAVSKYAHLEREDKGTTFALQFNHGNVNAQVETPVNLYCV